MPTFVTMTFHLLTIFATHFHLTLLHIHSLHLLRYPDSTVDNINHFFNDF